MMPLDNNLIPIKWTRLGKVVQWKPQWFGHIERMTVYWIQHNALHVRFKEKRNKGRPRLWWILDRQHKWGHRINWTDIEGSNEPDKWLRTTAVICSYPSWWWYTHILIISIGGCWLQGATNSCLIQNFHTRSLDCFRLKFRVPQFLTVILQGFHFKEFKLRFYSDT